MTKPSNKFSGQSRRMFTHFELTPLGSLGVNRASEQHLFKILVTLFDYL